MSDIDAQAVRARTSMSVDGTPFPTNSTPPSFPEKYTKELQKRHLSCSSIIWRKVFPFTRASTPSAGPLIFY
ncbi:hypothetical protein [Pseudomonas putida]|uniref:hypothetical protein n=1 Tax=Pseudomonas putida TaxID=303 RepID=UPI001C2CE8F7|nr:hypothetical protein [Pseudomonas putida]